MAVRETVMYGDPILRRKARRVPRFDAALPRLVADMFATMHAARGVGLAAPQIGLSIRLLVVELDDPAGGQHHKVALANPEIVAAQGEQIGSDGCLSIPGYYGANVRRAAEVVVRAQDPRGKPVRLAATGLFAWALQHEIDHLDGILFLDRLDRPEDLRPIAPAPAVEEERVVVE
jgi:peptide deformylase